MGASEFFTGEAGGHRWQRIPPNERHGRVHTSTITVAVLPEPSPVEVTLRECDVEITACRGSGAGGQHRNKTSSAIQLRHTSGITVRSEGERSQYQNKALAMFVLRCRLHAAQQRAASGSLNDSRRQQIGSGMRGDKRRTVSAKRGIVDDHVTGQRWTYEAYLAGKW